MPQIHDIGKRHFVHTMKYPARSFPLIDRGDTQEIEDPYRNGTSLVFRIPLSRTAVVFGRWQTRYSEDYALRRAIQARDLDVA
jgi:hypothetical protein